MSIDIEKIILAHGQTIGFLNSVVKFVAEKRMKKEKETEVIKRIILNQRYLKYVCQGNYDSKYFVDYENKVIDYLKTIFDNELSDCFAISCKNLMWKFRYHEQLEDYDIENSLESFIKLCRKRRYNVS